MSWMIVHPKRLKYFRNKALNPRQFVISTPYFSIALPGFHCSSQTSCMLSFCFWTCTYRPFEPWWVLDVKCFEVAYWKSHRSCNCNAVMLYIAGRRWYFRYTVVFFIIFSPLFLKISTLFREVYLFCSFFRFLFLIYCLLFHLPFLLQIELSACQQHADLLFYIHHHNFSGICQSVCSLSAVRNGRSGRLHPASRNRFVYLMEWQAIVMNK